jgi:hypothetical protein
LSCSLHRQLPALACTKLRSKAQVVAVTKMCFPVAMGNALATHSGALS